jgi:hypothetical protein
MAMPFFACVLAGMASGRLVAVRFAEALLQKGFALV